MTGITVLHLYSSTPLKFYSFTELVGGWAAAYRNYVAYEPIMLQDVAPLHAELIIGF